MTSYIPQSSGIRRRHECEDCPKGFFVCNDPARLRCNRCYAKWVKRNAGPPVYNFDASIDTPAAQTILWPAMECITHIEDDDVDLHRTYDAYYVSQLCRAVSTPYTGDEERLAQQQKKLNQKPFDSQQYSAPMVNARLRILFETAVSYHAGGPMFYDVGGDNNGYGEDRGLTFSGRMNFILEILAANKDVAMDVIEGRGVTAFVRNPAKFVARKRDNKTSNTNKEKFNKLGKEVEARQSKRAKSMASGSQAPETEAEDRSSV